MINNVILDLDHTLIHCPDRVPESFGPYLQYLKYHNIIIGDYVYLIFERPFLKEFLRSLRGKNIAIWTAADQDYAHFITENIIKPYLYPDQSISFIWSRGACDESSRRYGILKDLDLVFENFPQFKRENTVIIDDNPDLAAQNNSVYTIKKYEVTNIDDVELLKLI